MLETDYLIVGAGAIGMTFADQLLTDSDANIIIVDRHDMAGGHWNDAYPFVRLHQPSTFYGVGSRTLGSNRIDETGYNKGYYELASGSEVQAYFDGLMRERFLPSGRVRFFPMSEYQEGPQIASLLSDKIEKVHVRKKIVDGTYFNTKIPATSTPAYSVSDKVTCISPDLLPRTAAAHNFYTIVGGGKTAMDVGIWLLQNQVSPDKIRWIIPRDSWLINRETTQPGDLHFHQFLDGKASSIEAAAFGNDIEDVFDRLERTGQMLRIDKNVRPTMYHNATMSVAEVEALGYIKDVLRHGHVQRIEEDAIVFNSMTVPSRSSDLYIDCTANGFEVRPTIPVFEENRITVQLLRPGLVCFSAAVIAHVETLRRDTEAKNHLCPPMALPNTPKDWLRSQYEENELTKRWTNEEGLRNWVAGHRLSGANLRTAVSTEPNEELHRIKIKIKNAAPYLEANLKRILDIRDS